MANTAYATRAKSSKSNGTVPKSGKSGNGDSEKYIPKKPHPTHTNRLQRPARLSGSTSTTASSKSSGTTISPPMAKEQLSKAAHDILSPEPTTTFFREMFDFIQDKGKDLTKLEVDQKLVNWGLAIPGVKEKLATFPPDVQNSVEQFRTADVSTLQDIDSLGFSQGAVGPTFVHGFRRPMNPKSHRKFEKIRRAWEGQLKIDGGKKYVSIVENNGSPVKYVDKLMFENWGDTVENTPAVLPL